MATTTISKIQRQAERVAARAAYIQTAEVSLHGDYALVKSEFDAEEIYRVQIENGLPVSCNCPDFYYRSRRDPSHVCKHMEAVDVCLAATLPLMGTPEMRRMVRSAESIFKVRRSAPNSQLIASMQLPEGTKVVKVAKNAKKNANAFVLVLPLVAAEEEVVIVEEVALVEVTELEEVTKPIVAEARRQPIEKKWNLPAWMLFGMPYVRNGSTVFPKGFPMIEANIPTIATKVPTNVVSLSPDCLPIAA